MGGVDKRLADLLGLLLPLLFQHRAGSGLCMFPPLCFLPLLSLAPPSHPFFSFWTLCSPSVSLNLYLYFQPTFTNFCTSFYALHSRAVLYLEAVIALIKDNDKGINEVKPKESLRVLNSSDTQLTEAIKEL